MHKIPEDPTSDQFDLSENDSTLKEPSFACSKPPSPQEDTTNNNGWASLWAFTRPNNSPSVSLFVRDENLLTKRNGDIKRALPSPVASLGPLSFPPSRRSIASIASQLSSKSWMSERSGDSGYFSITSLELSPTRVTHESAPVIPHHDLQQVFDQSMASQEPLSNVFPEIDVHTEPVAILVRSSDKVLGVTSAGSEEDKWPGHKLAVLVADTSIPAEIMEANAGNLDKPSFLCLQELEQTKPFLTAGGASVISKDLTQPSVAFIQRSEPQIDSSSCSITTLSVSSQAKVALTIVDGRQPSTRVRDISFSMEDAEKINVHAANLRSFIPESIDQGSSECSLGRDHIRRREKRKQKENDECGQPFPLPMRRSLHSTKPSHSELKLGQTSRRAALSDVWPTTRPARRRRSNSLPRLPKRRKSDWRDEDVQ